MGRSLRVGGRALTTCFLLVLIVCPKRLNYDPPPTPFAQSWNRGWRKTEERVFCAGRDERIRCRASGRRAVPPPPLLHQSTPSQRTPRINRPMCRSADRSERLRPARRCQTRTTQQRPPQILRRPAAVAVMAAVVVAVAVPPARRRAVRAAFRSHHSITSSSRSRSTWWFANVTWTHASASSMFAGGCARNRSADLLPDLRVAEQNR